MPAPKTEGPTAEVLRALAAQPKAASKRLTMGDLAVAAYGRDTHRTRVRTASLLFSLISRGKVRRIARGQFALVAATKKEHVALTGEGS